MAKDQVMHFTSSRSAWLLWMETGSFYKSAFLLSWALKLTPPSYILLYPDEDEFLAQSSVMFQFKSGCHIKR